MSQVDTEPDIRDARRRARRLSPVARRAQLLQAAVRVVAARGLGASGLHQEIAASAGVSNATVFSYFATRDNLIDAVLGDVERELEVLAEGILLREGSARQNALDLLFAFADWVGTHRDHARIWLEWGTATRESYWPRYLASLAWHVRLWSAAMTHARPRPATGKALAAHDVAQLIVGSGHMIVQMMFAGRTRETVDHYIEALISAVLD